MYASVSVFISAAAEDSNTNYNVAHFHGILPLILRSFFPLFFHSLGLIVYDKYRYINLFIGCIYIGYINVSITLKRGVIDNPSSSSFFTHSSEFRRKQTHLSERVCFLLCFVLLVFYSHTNVLLIDFCFFLRRIERAPGACHCGEWTTRTQELSEFRKPDRAFQIGF